MKKVITILFITLSVSLLCAQEQKVIIFSYDAVEDTIIEKKKKTIYKLDKKHAFRYNEGKNRKIEVKYDSIKNDIKSYKSFIETNREKKFPDFFDEYSFYIYVRDSATEGCLFEVEKIWLVEEKISN